MSVNDQKSGNTRNRNNPLHDVVPPVGNTNRSNNTQFFAGLNDIQFDTKSIAAYFKAGDMVKGFAALIGLFLGMNIQNFLKPEEDGEKKKDEGNKTPTSDGGSANNTIIAGKYPDVWAKENSLSLDENAFLSNAKVTDVFSIRDVHPVSGKRNVAHFGVDYGLEYGHVLQSASQSRLLYAGKAGAGGFTTMRDIGQGVYIIDMHQSTLLKSISTNAKTFDEKYPLLKAGEAYGKVGNSGGVTGTHLDRRGIVNDGEGNYFYVNLQGVDTTTLKDLNVRKALIKKSNEELDGTENNYKNRVPDKTFLKIIKAFEQEKYKGSLETIASTSSTSNSGGRTGDKIDNLNLQKPFFVAINGNDSLDRNDKKYSVTQQAIGVEKHPVNGKTIVVGEMVIRDENGEIMKFKGSDGQMREARFTFRSGGFDKGYMPGLDGKIPNLTYKIDWDNMRTTNLKDGMITYDTNKNVRAGFFLPLKNTRNLNGRYGFGYHPDGDSQEETLYANRALYDGLEEDGTQGCGGFGKTRKDGDKVVITNDDKDVQIALNILKGKDNRATVVNTLPPIDSAVFEKQYIANANVNIPLKPT